MEYDVPYSAAQLMKTLSEIPGQFQEALPAPTLEQGLIVMSIPDKPTSRNQTYIKI